MAAAVSQDAGKTNLKKQSDNELGHVQTHTPLLGDTPGRCVLRVQPVFVLQTVSFFL